MTTAFKLSDFNRKDTVVLIDGTTGTVFSTGSKKIVVMTDDGKTLLVLPEQVREVL
jgi:preprotein translocase subunit YajC